MYPEETITTTSKGEKEARVIVDDGRFVVYEYKKLDGKKVEGKYSILLVYKDGKKERLMIVTLKNEKEMIVDRVEIKGEMAMYDEKNSKVVKF
ncbi:MAG: hypothetical protein QW153_01205 [Candidatus Bilamarchaeaceae archaeon]